MGIALSQADHSSLIRLDGVVDISAAAELKAALLRALEAGAEIRISVDEAAELDITALQLIWATAREASLRGVGFALAWQPPESVRSSLASAGLTGLALLE